MYQSETTYLVPGLTVTGADIHLASPDVRDVMVTARLFCPSLPPSFQLDVAWLVPHLSNVQLAGPDPDAAPVSADGFPMRLAPTAYAVTPGSSEETKAARTAPMSSLDSRTRRYPYR